MKYATKLLSNIDHRVQPRLEMRRATSTYLTELKLMLLPSKLQGPANKHQDSPRMARWLAIYCDDGVLALLEGEAVEFFLDVLHAQKLFSLKCEHRSFLVETGQACPVLIKRVVIVVNKRLSNAIHVHLQSVNSATHGNRAVDAATQFKAALHTFKKLQAT
jgi:hypothetical protein